MRSSMFYLLLLFFVSQSQSCTEAKANVQNSEDSIGTPVANYDFGAQLFSSDFTDVELFLSDIKKRHEGKTIILDLWGTSCPPCLKDFSNSHEIKKELIVKMLSSYIYALDEAQNLTNGTKLFKKCN